MAGIGIAKIHPGFDERNRGVYPRTFAAPQLWDELDSWNEHPICHPISRKPAPVAFALVAATGGESSESRSVWPHISVRPIRLQALDHANQCIGIVGLHVISIGPQVVGSRDIRRFIG